MSGSLRDRIPTNHNEPSERGADAVGVRLSTSRLSRAKHALHSCLVTSIGGRPSLYVCVFSNYHIGCWRCQKSRIAVYLADVNGESSQRSLGPTRYARGLDIGIAVCVYGVLDGRFQRLSSMPVTPGPIAVSYHVAQRVGLLLIRQLLGGGGGGGGGRWGKIIRPDSVLIYCLGS
jgi:hypothetical protein